MPGCLLYPLLSAKFLQLCPIVPFQHNSYKGFLKVADEFSGTAAGNLANAYAGICYAQLGKYEDAVKYQDKFSAKDQLVSPAILGTIGNCYAEMGQLDKAAGTLLKAADKADSQALSPIYLIQAGQLFSFK